MKTTKTLLIILGLLFITISCKKTQKETTDTQTQQNEKTEQSEKTGKEYTSAYVCPMHCKGSGSEQEGECPVCGMEYVKNENYENHTP